MPATVFGRMRRSRAILSASFMSAADTSDVVDEVAELGELLSEGGVFGLKATSFIGPSDDIAGACLSGSDVRRLFTTSRVTREVTA